MSADVSNMSDLATALKVATVDADYLITEGRYIFTLEDRGVVIEAYQGSTPNSQAKLRSKKWMDESRASEKVRLICQVDGRKVSASNSPDSFVKYAAEAKMK